MIEKSEYFSDVMKKHFNKEPVITKEDNEDFKNSTKCWIFHNDYIDDEVKIRDKKKKLWFTSYYARTRQIQSWNKYYTKWIRKMYELYHQ